MFRWKGIANANIGKLKQIILSMPTIGCSLLGLCNVFEDKETTMKKFNFVRAIGALFAFSFLVAACGDDDGAAVREIGSNGSESVSASASSSGSSSSSASASSSAPSEAPESGVVGDFGSDNGYEYASDVSSHRLVVDDICEINELLGADTIDFGAVKAIYVDGKNSVKSDGSVRTIGGFAAADGKKHQNDDYYGAAGSLNSFVSSALDGTGMFEGETDSVRKQGVQKGIQNQTMIAWTVHELNSALGKATDGNLEGAVHNWDEGWAFYHGASGSCGPYGTGNKRGGNYGTLGEDGETALANELILNAMIAGRDAIIAGDIAGATEAANSVLRAVTIVYSQATMRYATKVEGDIAKGDLAKARVHQAEGLSFWRVLEPSIGAVGPAGAGTIATINSAYDLSNVPGSGATSDEVRTALYPIWGMLEISKEDMGELQ